MNWFNWLADGSIKSMGLSVATCYFIQIPADQRPHQGTCEDLQVVQIQPCRNNAFVQQLDFHLGGGKIYRATTGSFKEPLDGMHQEKMSDLLHPAHSFNFVQNGAPHSIQCFLVVFLSPQWKCHIWWCSLLHRLKWVPIDAHVWTCLAQHHVIFAVNHFEPIPFPLNPKIHDFVFGESTEPTWTNHNQLNQL